MGKINVKRIPISYEQRKKNSIKKESIFCEVSGRYMTNEDTDFKDFIKLNIFSDNGNQEVKDKKLCEIIISKEKLLKLLQ